MREIHLFTFLPKISMNAINPTKCKNKVFVAALLSGEYRGLYFGHKTIFIPPPPF
jgi:hypothetical protein